MNEDGSMARRTELRKMADEFNLKLISIRDMIAYRLKQESIVEEGVEVDMPTEHGHFRLIPFRQKSNGLEHVALFRDIPGNKMNRFWCVCIPLVPQEICIWLQALRLRRTTA
ncbi:MAG: hypothetical protein ACLUE2_06230 [Bacteroides cellulosilyticus]